MEKMTQGPGCLEEPLASVRVDGGKDQSQKAS